jgi:non-ribosomal peptide synthetase component F
VDESDAGLRATFEYRTSLFDITVIEAMARHFANLLTAACADPARRICDLRMLADDEMHRMLASWNDNALSRETTAGASAVRTVGSVLAAAGSHYLRRH